MKGCYGFTTVRVSWVVVMLVHFLQVGFGKGPPSKCLWVDGVDPTMSDSQVEKHFSRYGTIVNIGFDRQRCTVVVAYNSVDTAKEAMLDLRGTIIGKTRVRVLVRMTIKEFLLLLLLGHLCRLTSVAKKQVWHSFKHWNKETLMDQIFHLDLTRGFHLALDEVASTHMADSFTVVTNRWIMGITLLWRGVAEEGTIWIT